jgi:hypothetical protein
MLGPENFNFEDSASPADDVEEQEEHVRESTEAETETESAAESVNYEVTAWKKFDTFRQNLENATTFEDLEAAVREYATENDDGQEVVIAWNPLSEKPAEAAADDTPEIDMETSLDLILDLIDRARDGDVPEEGGGIEWSQLGVHNELGDAFNRILQDTHGKTAAI